MLMKRDQGSCGAAAPERKRDRKRKEKEKAKKNKIKKFRGWFQYARYVFTEVTILLPTTCGLLESVACLTFAMHGVLGVMNCVPAEEKTEQRRRMRNCRPLEAIVEIPPHKYSHSFYSRKSKLAFHDDDDDDDDDDDCTVHK